MHLIGVYKCKFNLNLLKKHGSLDLGIYFFQQFVAKKRNKQRS